jgi:N-acetylneuraminate synthase
LLKWNEVIPVNNRSFIIAEAGVNHNGSPQLARELVSAAAESGVDAVKFQTFRAKNVVTASAKKAEYQIVNTGESGSQLEMIQSLELDESIFKELAVQAKNAGLQFLSTAFDLESLRFLTDDIRVDTIKIPSGEATNGPYILACARLGRPIILSTGMCTLKEVASALDVIAYGILDLPTPRSLKDVEGLATTEDGHASLKDRVTVLHCTTEYPAPFEEVNLRAMGLIGQHFGLPVGYSDHTKGISVPIAAAALGARIIEKHFTLDRNMEGPDHAASLEPSELSAMVKAIRETEAALGEPVKDVSPSEAKNRTIARRSIVAARAISAGETYSADMLSTKRPGGGLSPMKIWDIIGRKAERDYAPDEAVDPPTEKPK